MPERDNQVRHLTKHLLDETLWNVVVAQSAKGPA